MKFPSDFQHVILSKENLYEAREK